MKTVDPEEVEIKVIDYDTREVMSKRKVKFVNVMIVVVI